jgi:hypothetical protein
MRRWSVWALVGGFVGVSGALLLSPIGPLGAALRAEPQGVEAARSGPVPRLLPLAEFGGATRVVGSDGRYAYVNLGRRIAVVDMADPQRPSLRGQTAALADPPMAIAAAGGVAVVVAGEPQGSGGYPSPAGVGDGATRAWLIDVRDPDRPRRAAVVPIDGALPALAVADGRAYLARADGHLQVLDVRDPDQPHPFADLALPGAARDLSVVGPYLSVVDSGGLRTFVLGADGALAAQGELPLRGAQMLDLAGRWAYVADIFGRLWVVDVGDLAHPKVVGSLPGETVISDLAVGGSRAYLAVATGVRVVDVAVPEWPWQVTLQGMPGGWGQLAVFGDHALAGRGAAGLRVVDAEHRGTLPESQARLPSGAARAVAVAGRYAYVAADGAGLWVVDIEAPSQPRLVGALGAPGATDLALAGDLAYLACGRDGLRVVSVADPTLPRELGRFRTPDSALGVAVRDTLAFVAADRAGLRLADVSDPGQPRLVGLYDLPQRVLDVQVDGDRAYLAAGSDGLRVLDVSDATRPRELGFYNAPDEALGLALRGARGLVTYGQGGLRALDLSQPARPRQLGALLVGDARHAIQAADGDYVAAGRQGLLVVDGTSDPARPRAVAGGGTGGEALDVALAAGAVLVAQGEDGLALWQRVAGWPIYLPRADSR